MKVFSRSLMVITLIAVVFSRAFAKQKTEKGHKESPRLPKPQWLKIIDQGNNDPRLKGYLTPEGIKVEIVADHPVVTNPVGMTFGPNGTLFVLEWRPLPGATFPEFYQETIHYKDGTTRKIGTVRKVTKDARGQVKQVYKDRVKVLRDTKGKGIYDEAKVILEDELPSRILLHDGWLYLSGLGTVRRFKQSKADGPYDVREVIAQGFCGFHRYQVSGMTIGNDGWLYITCGGDDNFVEGSDGSRATALRTGGVFRCRPDGSKMQVFSIGYRNPHGNVAFDASFNIFHVDSDNKGSRKDIGCRLIHVAEESDFGWRLQMGELGGVLDRVRGAAFGELPGKMPAMLKTGPGTAGGLVIYNETGFPEQYRGLLYYPDPYRKLIRAYKVMPRGASFEVAEEFEFMKSTDPLFRPCQMVLGPDGAMYVCDWRSALEEKGQLWGDNKHGRIYRLSWAGTAKKDKDMEEEQPALPLRGMDSWAKIAKLSDEDLLKTLASEEFSFRLRAQRELVRRGPKHRPALLKLVGDSEEPLPARLAALGALQSFWDGDVHKVFCKLLRESDADLRRLAADGLALNCPKGDETAHRELLTLLDDPELEVRRAGALAIGRIAAPGAADALINAFKFDRGKDRYLQDGLVRAIERLGKNGIQKLLDLGDSGVASERDKIVEAFQTLRTAPALPFLGTLLRNPHLSVNQRAGLVRSYSNYLLSQAKVPSLDPSIAVKPMIAYLARHPKEDPEVKRAGIVVLGCSGPLVNKQARTWLLSLLDEKNQETGALRIEALRTLNFLDSAAAQLIAPSFLKRKDLPSQRAAVAILGLQPAGAKMVATRFLAKELSGELRPDVMAILRKHAAKDPEIAKLLAEVKRMTRKDEGK